MAAFSGWGWHGLAGAVAEGARRPRPAGRGAGRLAGPGREAVEGRRGAAAGAAAGADAEEWGSAEAAARVGGPGRPLGRRRDVGAGGRPCAGRALELLPWGPPAAVALRVC